MGNSMFVRGGWQFHGCMLLLHNKEFVYSAIQHTAYTYHIVMVIQHCTLLSFTINIHNIQHMKRPSCEDCTFCDPQIKEKEAMGFSYCTYMLRYCYSIVNVHH